MARVVLVASGKGGVGKTTLVAGLGVNLARIGEKVLLIDANFGLRNLDIVLGMADMVSYDLYDVVTKKCSPDKAVLAHPAIQNLFFIASPQCQDLSALTKQSFKQLVDGLTEEYDYIIIDGAAGINDVLLCLPSCDEAIIVVTPSYTSIRDGEALSYVFAKSSIIELKMIVNMVDRHVMKKSRAYNIDDMIDHIRIPLLGIVPYDQRVHRDMCVNLPFYEDFYVKANEAFRNIVQRMLGKKVKIMRIK